MFSWPERIAGYVILGYLGYVLICMILGTLPLTLFGIGPASMGFLVVESFNIRNHVQQFASGVRAA